MAPGGQPEARGTTPARQAGREPRAAAATRWGRRYRALALVLLGMLVLASVAVGPGVARADDQFKVWRSPQFGLTMAYPPSWSVSEERSDPERGDVVILGNETSALLVGLLHDTRTPREMADDLIQTQKAQTPDLAVVQSTETSAGSVLMFLQYTIRPGSDEAMLIDEKVLLGTLQAGNSTITLRGMVPDRANVESELDQIEGIIGTLSPG